MKATALACLIAALFAGPAQAQDELADGLLDYYKQLHANPELSHFEIKTSASLAAQLRKAGYKVTEKVGKYADGSQAWGIVAVLENGPGPRLLIRADMDALPIREETLLPYASKVLAKSLAGQEVGVMHACGHDVHMTTLLGAARALAARRNEWHGTVVLVGQPSEETLDGAEAMLRDGLYERFGRPDMALAMHDSSSMAAGHVGVPPGPMHAAVTSIDVTIRGVGGHGAQPQNTKDPVVMAAQFINQLQTIVSRNQHPFDPAVVTVGSIHGGTKRNIIPDEVKLELTTRAMSEKGMKVILDGVRRAADGIAASHGLPDDRKPIVTIIEAETGRANINNPVLAARVKKAISAVLGADKVDDGFAIMGSEDFTQFGLPDRSVPTLMFNVGVVDHELLAKSKEGKAYVPGQHTSKFAPLPEPTLRASIKAMTAAAIALMQK